MKWLGLGACAAGLMACATPQTIHIETVPPGVAVSIDDEYVGSSPAAFALDDIDDLETLRVVGEKTSYETSIKTITKKPSGRFPGQVFLKLDRSQATGAMSAASSPASGPRSDARQGFSINCFVDDADVQGF